MKPIVQFLLIGALAYCVQQWLAPKDVVLVTAHNIKMLEKDWLAATGRQADAQKRQQLVDTYVEDEILFREAIKANLHHSPRLKLHIAKLVAFLELGEAGDDVDSLFEQAIDTGLLSRDRGTRNSLASAIREQALEDAEPFVVNDSAVERYYAEHAGEYTKPESLSFDHLYLSKSRHINPEQKIRELTARLEGAKNAVEKEDRQALIALGDPFIKGAHFSDLGITEIEYLMGEDFSAAVKGAAAGEWFGPVLSNYGWHWVFITARTAANTLPLSEVKPRVVRQLRQQWRQQTLATALEKTKQNYKVIVKWPAGDANALSPVREDES